MKANLVDFSLVSKEDIAWLAGLLEGEGSFTSRGRSATITLVMTDLDIVERVRNLMSPASTITIIPQSHRDRKTVYNTCVSGDLAKAWMRLILPYMGSRRSQKINESIRASSMCRKGLHNIGDNKQCHLCKLNTDKVRRANKALLRMVR